MCESVRPSSDAVSLVDGGDDDDDGYDDLDGDDGGRWIEQRVSVWR